MKSIVILLSIVALTFGKIIPKSQEDDEIDVDAAQNFNNYYQNLMNLSPSEREMLGLTMNRDSSGFPNDFMMSMDQYSPMDFMNYQGMGMGMYPGMSGSYPNMGMNYPNMMMPNFNSYPGNYQGLAKTPSSSSCQCVQVCPPCLPWFPCNPCSCPCQTNPPDSNTPPTITTTPEPTTTTTLLTTVSQEITQTPPSNCIPCQPCAPCGPIWWMPCSPCNCNNGCQTSAPIIPTVAPARNPPINNNGINNINTSNNNNNCQCICAPCPPWQDICPPCPKNCPCH